MSLRQAVKLSTIIYENGDIVEVRYNSDWYKAVVLETFKDIYGMR